MFNEDFAGDVGAKNEDICSVIPTLVGGVAQICDPGADPWYGPRQGLHSNEVPFRSDLRFRRPRFVEKLLALKPLREEIREARCALIANIIYAHARSHDTWVFYSRDRNHYAEQARRYSPPYYTFANMMPAVGSIEEAGLIDHERTSPSPSARRRSRIRAAAALRELLAELCPDLVVEQREVIILRDAAKRHRDYRDSERICAMRKDVIAHNDFLACADIRVDHPSARYDEAGFLRVQDRWLDPPPRHGGRVRLILGAQIILRRVDQPVGHIGLRRPLATAAQRGT